MPNWFGNLVVDELRHAPRGYRTLAKARKRVAATEQTILKLFGSEAGQGANLAHVESIGADALQPEFHSASWWKMYLGNSAATILRSTSRIQRNIIAERVLGLIRKPERRYSR